MSLLLKGGLVVTQDPHRRVVPGDLFVEGGQIAAIGETPEHADEVLDCRGCAVLPGLINVHQHVANTLLRGTADEVPLEEMLAKQQGRRPHRVIEMDQDMIDATVEGFANAVYRCSRAGLEMVMIHGGHGHLIAQFLSPYANKRTDAYGGRKPVPRATRRRPQPVSEIPSQFRPYFAPDDLV